MTTEQVLTSVDKKLSTTLNGTGTPMDLSDCFVYCPRIVHPALAQLLQTQLSVLG